MSNPYDNAAKPDIKGMSIDFEPPFSKEALEMEITQREAFLAQRNEIDAHRAKVIEENEALRAFNARPAIDGSPSGLLG